MLSKTKIKFRSRKKTNPELVETLKLATNNPKWLLIAKILSGPTTAQSKINLNQIDKESKTGDTIIIPGKVLSKGDLTKKVKICALSISKEANEKLKDTKSEYTTLLNEINKNKKAEGINLIK
jgi:large subunit ribosomal protein L18e